MNLKDIEPGWYKITEYGQQEEIFYLVGFKYKNLAKNPKNDKYYYNISYSSHGYWRHKDHYWLQETDTIYKMTPQEINEYKLESL